MVWKPCNYRRGEYNEPMDTKWYVVWKGRRTGVFSSWEEVRPLVEGYPGAQFKAFPTREEAERALRAGYAAHAGKPATLGRWRTAPHPPLVPSVVVDAAASGPRGPVEYRGLRLDTGEVLFQRGPYPVGTVNIGEFLAIVHALAWLHQRGLGWPVYSDSRTAIRWVKQGRCRTRLPRTPEAEVVFDLIARAERWLAEHPRHNPVLKWDTRAWGEVPADFYRK